MLARQLLIGFLAVIVPSTVLLGTVTLYSLVSLDRVTRELLEITRSHEAVTDLNATLHQLGAPLGAFMLGGDVSNRRRFDELIRAAEGKLKTCGEGSCHGSSQTPASMAAKIRPALAQLELDGHRLFERGPGGGAGRVEAVRRTVRGVRDVMEPMMAAVHVRGEELKREADTVRAHAWFMTETLTGVVLLAGVLAALLISRRISHPLGELLLGIRRVMTGDWSHEVKAPPRGEIGELASAFNAMVHELRERRSELEEQNRTLEARVRQRTEELHEKEGALAQSEKLASLGLLAAGVAHELNNPLTSIVMNANLLMEDPHGDAELLRGLRKIDADAARCRRIIDDLRAFARVPQVERVRGEVAAVIEQALAASAHELSRRNVAVHRDLAPDLPEVSWDPHRMVQVITNLLANAAQATNGSGHRVVIRGRRDGDWLRLEVEDDAGGIPPQARTRIFDPFFTTKPDGTGLGLSISHGIVIEHGGRIEVESRTREEVGPDGATGTTVRIVLPIAPGGPASP